MNDTKECLFLTDDGRCNHTDNNGPDSCAECQGDCDRRETEFSRKIKQVAINSSFRKRY